MQPVLLNSCAKAATAAEARFRIDVPIAPSRGTRVIALDGGATAVVRQVSELPWANARFFTCKVPENLADGAGWLADVELRDIDGVQTRLSEQLVDADVVVMIATADDGALCASAIGGACTLRGIMTAGLILGDRKTVGAAVSALRPHARVLMVTADMHDVSEVLTALRA
jgi:hypothetical protein